MKLLLLILSTGVAIAGGFLALTYPSYRGQMRTARARLAGAGVLHAAHGVIEYAMEGEGPPVLSLHGAGGGWDQGLWAARMAFGDGYQFLAVSRYGYLRSPIPPAASIKMQAALYRELLDYLGIHRVIVLGASAGGPSAMQFANDYPERTTALVLLSAVSEPSATGDKPPVYIAAIHLIQQSDYAYWLAARFFRPGILSLMGIPAGVYANLTPAQKELAQGMLDTMHPMSLRYRGTVNDEEMVCRERVSADRISAPTVILHAKDDALVSYRHAEHAHQAIAGSRLRLYDTGGHALLPQICSVRRDIAELMTAVPVGRVSDLPRPGGRIEVDGGVACRPSATRSVYAPKRNGQEGHYLH